MKKFIFVIFLFLIVFHMSSLKTEAACGTWNGTSTAGSCAAPGGSLCPNDLSRCCNPLSECYPEQQPSNQTTSTTNLPDIISCSSNNIGSLSSISCELPDGTKEYCTTSTDCKKRQAQVAGQPKCIQTGWSGESCPTNYTRCPSNINASYCCEDVTDCSDFVSSTYTQASLNLCKTVNDKDYQACVSCMGTDGSGTNGVWTGLGCLKFSPLEFTRQVLQIAIGLGGGIAFLMLIYGAFLMTTASGNPEAADNAKQIITGAITGLLVIIFSVVILNIIGVQILQIPGL